MVMQMHHTVMLYTNCLNRLGNDNTLVWVQNFWCEITEYCTQLTAYFGSMYSEIWHFKLVLLIMDAYMIAVCIIVICETEF